jgi:hypothetical protein
MTSLGQIQRSLGVTDALHAFYNIVNSLAQNPVVHATVGTTATGVAVAGAPIAAAVVCTVVVLIKAFDVFSGNEEVKTILDEVSIMIADLKGYSSTIDNLEELNEETKNAKINLYNHLTKLVAIIATLTSQFEKEGNRQKKIGTLTPNFYIGEIMKQITFINTSFMFILANNTMPKFIESHMKGGGKKEMENIIMSTDVTTQAAANEIKTNIETIINNNETLGGKRRRNTKTKRRRNKKTKRRRNKKTKRRRKYK